MKRPILNKEKKKLNRKFRRSNKSVEGTCHGERCLPVSIDKVVKGSPRSNVVRCKSFTIAAVATMSAGKSTLLNAMIGLSLLPSRKTACTSTIFSIVDEDGMSGFEVRRVDGARKGAWEPASHVNIARYNDSGCQDVEVRCDIKGISNIADGKKTIKLKLVDTPGPNNAANRSHEAILKRALATSDFAAIIFVLNATELHTTDEESMLKALKDWVENSARPISFVFVLNQMDAVLSGEDMPLGVPFVVEQTKKYLRDSIGFEDPVVIPTWATLALRTRSMMAGSFVVRPSKERQVVSDIENILCHAAEIEKSHDRRLWRHKSKLQQDDYCNLQSGVRISKEKLQAAEKLSGINQLEGWIQKQITHNVKRGVKDEHSRKRKV